MTWGRIRRYLIILVGCLICSASINLFLVPSHLLSGGIGGVGIIFYYLFGLPIGAQMLVYNLPLFFAAYKTMGRAYTLDIVMGTVFFSFCVDAMSVLHAYAPVSDTMLAAVYGGVFSGIGAGVVFRMNGSTGGLDIVAAIIKKYYSLNMGTVIFGINCVIMCVAAVLFGVMPAMFTLISMFVSANVTDKVVAGLVERKTIIVISEHSEALAEGIIHEVGRGATFLKGEGAFTHKRKDVLFVVVNLTQIAKIKLIVGMIDPQAFMIVMSAGEVMGRGFTMPGIQLDALIHARSEQQKRQREASLQEKKQQQEKLRLAQSMPEAQKIPLDAEEGTETGK